MDQDNARTSLEIWTTQDVAAHCGMSRHGIDGLARKGLIPCWMHGSRRRFSAKRVRAWWIVYQESDDCHTKYRLAPS